MYRVTIVTAWVLFLLFPFSAQAARLTAYTTVEPELLAAYAKAFAAKHPDIRVSWVRDSAGPIAARLLAEKDAPKADIVFGLAISALLPLEQSGMFASYRPAGADALLPEMRDSRKNPIWVGMDSWTSAFFVNSRELEKRELPVPKSWADLADPKYKGLIVMPHPVSSSTGYMNVYAWVRIMGEEGAWNYMDRLAKNVKMYVHSGSRPAQMAAQGEIPIGVSFAACAPPYLKRKAPILLVIPQEGAGWDIEVAALLKNSPNLDSARKLMDFAASPEVSALAAANGFIPARRDALTPELEPIRASLVPMDHAKSAAAKQRLLREWRIRYEGK